MEENYATDANDPWGMEKDEQDGVLRFWDSPRRDVHDLLSTLLPSADGTHSDSPPSPQTVRVALEGLGSVNFVGGSMVPSPVAGESDEGFFCPALDPGSEIPSRITLTWMPFAGPDCNVCCVLRDIIHASDCCNTKLSIHCYLGSIHHALLVIHHFVDEIVEEKFIADLSSLDAASVEQFLVDYSYCRNRDGQVLVQDTHGTFYDAFSVEMDCIDECLPVPAVAPPLSSPNPTTEAGLLTQAPQAATSAAAAGAGTQHPKPVLDAVAWAIPELVLPVSAGAPGASLTQRHLLLNSGSDQSMTAAIGSHHRLVIPKTGIAAQVSSFLASYFIRRLFGDLLGSQRERTGLLTFEDIAKHFHLPITKAAKELQICTTALKKVCRKYKLYRWPHRKVQSSMKRIESLETSLVGQTGEVAARTLFLLHIEHKELRSLYAYRG